MRHIKAMNKVKLISLVPVLWALAACGINPVTGEREIQLVSQQSEIELGQKNYGSLQQSQGGSYEVDVSLSRYVNEVGQRVAAVADRKLPYEFVVVNNSVPNAWALPGGKIGINRGLLTELRNEAELAAVLGHEVVHAAARHSAKKMETGMAMNLGLIALGVSLRDKQEGQALMVAGSVGAALLGQKYSRDAELESDRYGMEYMVKAGYDPQGAVTLQETFLRLSKGRNPNWLEGLFASHPPSQERVEANRRYAAQLTRPGLTLGEQRYRQRIAALVKDIPAYNKYDEGRAALAKKNYSRAMELANQAIAHEPREALFHALKGDIYQAQNNHNTAVQHYQTAIQYNPNLFYYYLKRGMSYRQLGDRVKARADLQRSYQLLPTKEAADALRAL